MAGEVIVQNNGERDALGYTRAFHSIPSRGAKT